MNWSWGFCRRGSKREERKGDGWMIYFREEEKGAVLKSGSD
jgi:hypothetical protein